MEDGNSENEPLTQVEHWVICRVILTSGPSIPMEIVATALGRAQGSDHIWSYLSDLDKPEIRAEIQSMTMHYFVALRRASLVHVSWRARVQARVAGQTRSSGTRP